MSVFESPTAADPKLTLPNPLSEITLVFLVREQQDVWIEVLLPISPAGSTGWIRKADVTLTSTDYRVKIDKAGFRMTVRKGDTVVVTEEIGVGRGGAAPPTGEFYLLELLEVREEQRNRYGPYVYVISAPAAGNQPPFIGMSGAGDQPARIGAELTQDYVVMSDRAITTLSAMLPIGTPVEIQ